MSNEHLFEEWVDSVFFKIKEKFEVQYNIKINETSTSGSSSAGNVATVVGGLGAGFDDDMTKSVYYTGKNKKKNKSIIRRPR